MNYCQMLGLGKQNMELVFKNSKGEKVERGNQELVWRPSAYVIVKNEKEEILTVKFALNGKFMLPGGGVNIDESLQEAALRECMEETGHTIEIDGGVVDCKESLFYDDRKEQKFFHTVGVFFNAHVVPGLEVERFTDEQEILSVHWVDLKTTNIKDWHYYYQSIIEKLKKQ